MGDRSIIAGAHAALRQLRERVRRMFWLRCAGLGTDEVGDSGVSFDPGSPRADAAGDLVTFRVLDWSRGQSTATTPMGA